MMQFEFMRPATIEQALTILAERAKRARILAGGTDMLVYLRHGQGLEDVDTIVDITGIQELRQITEQGNQLVLGALVTHSMLVGDERVQSYAGALVRAAGYVGSPQIRNRGTVGGNVANAAVCADTVPPLIALDAQVVLASSSGKRSLPLAEFITGPNRTELAFGEMLLEIRFDKLPAQATWGFTRLARREALAIARMNVAVVANRDADGIVTDLRIAPGSVLASPARINEAEAVLLGKVPDQAMINEAGKAVAAKMIAVSGRRWSTDYKEPVVISLVERAIKQALGVEWK